MHELGLCDAMLKMMDQILEKEGSAACRVRRVVLEIGELSGVVPHFMEESWSTVPGYADCLDCKAHFRPAQSGFRCPECGGGKLKPVSGIDMTVKSIEVWDEEP